MKKYALFVSMAILIAACKPEKTYDMVVTGQVKGLKKGTLYLQKIADTTLVNVDSMVIDGHETFTLKSDLASAEIFFLFLDKYDGSKDNNSIPFFAEKDSIQINTTLKKFVANAKIKGSDAQDRLNEFRDMIGKFNDKRLDLIKAQLEAKQQTNLEAEQAANDALTNLLKRQYLYVANFAVTHNDSEIAPYLALVEIYDATTPILDTIYNALTDRVKESKYGLELNRYISEIKKFEASNRAVE